MTVSAHDMPVPGENAVGGETPLDNLLVHETPFTTETTVGGVTFMLTSSQILLSDTVYSFELQSGRLQLAERVLDNEEL